MRLPGSGGARPGQPLSSAAPPGRVREGHLRAPAVDDVQAATDAICANPFLSTGQRPAAGVRGGLIRGETTPGMISRGPFRLVAGVGFEPTTSGL